MKTKTIKLLPTSKGPLFSVKELSEHLGCTRQTIYDLIKKGMPHIKVGPRIIRFDLNAVFKFLDELDEQERKNN